MLSALLFLTLGMQEVSAAPKKSSEKTEEKAEAKVKKTKKPAAKKPVAKKPAPKKAVAKKSAPQGVTAHKKAGSEKQNTPAPAQAKLKKPLPKKGTPKTNKGKVGVETHNTPTPAQTQLKKPPPQRRAPDMGKKVDNSPATSTINRAPEKNTPNYDVRTTTPRVEKEQPRQGQVKRQPPSSKKSTLPPKKGKPATSKKVERQPPHSKKSTVPPKKATPKKKQVERQPPKSKSTLPPKKTTPKKSQQVERQPPHSKKSTLPPKKTTPKKAQKVERPKPAVKKSAPVEWVSRNVPAFSKPQSSVGSVKRSAAPPKRKGINRRGMTALGVQGINYGSGYMDGQTYLDPGVGLGVGVRLLNGVGVELSYAAFSEQLMMDSPERLNRPLQGVGQIYLMPRQKLSPFVSAGVVANAIDLQDQYQRNGKQKTAEQESLLLGGVLGAGLEYNVNKHLGLKAEGRYFNYQNTIESQPAIDDALQISAGVSVYF